VAKPLRLRWSLPDEYVESLRAKLIDNRHYDPDLLVGHEDVDVFKPDGSPLLMFRKGVLPGKVCGRAYHTLYYAAVPSTNRGDAAGGRHRRTKLNGTLSNTLESVPVLSGAVGYLRCRATKYTAENVRGWCHALPFVQAVNDVFRDQLPDRYEAQMTAVHRTARELVIPGTAFTTVTVNLNFRTHVHKDKGDLQEGFGVLSVLDGGEYTGGLLVFPKWRVAVEMRMGDVLLADVHEYHGNTPIVGVGNYARLSTVFYYHTATLRCGGSIEAG
jgi:hypothetical protein